MQKEIKYTGFSETPSDYECPDGDLATVVGMVPEDEAMKPIQQPTTMFTLPAGYSVVFIHKNIGYAHYIVCHDDDNNKTYYWIDSFEPQQVFTPEDFTEANRIADFQNKTIYDVNAIGNILIFAADLLNYYLWKGDLYKSLGDKIPEPTVSFTLFAADKATEHGRGSGIISASEEGLYIGPEQGQSDAYKDLVLGLYNKDTAEIKELNQFYLPFFVRYALELYDGNYIYQSVPILLLPSIHSNVVGGKRANTFQQENNYELSVKKFSLRYFANYDYTEWSDLVKGVAVFASQGVEVHDFDDDTFWSRGHRAAQGVPWVDYVSYVNIQGSRGNNYQQDLTSTEARLLQYVPLKPLADDKIIEKLLELQVFYKISNLKTREVIDPTLRPLLPIKEHVITNLVLQEQLPSDYHSNCQLTSKHLFVYNSRLVLGDVSRTFYESPFSNIVYDEEATAKTYIFQVTVTTQQGDRIVEYIMETREPIDMYYFYPDTRANHLDVFDADTEECVFSTELTQHDFLNGACYFGRLPGEATQGTQVQPGSFGRTTRGTTVTGEPKPLEKWNEKLPNLLYTSEIDDPFVFTTKGINSIGTGTILGIRPAVKTMSPSQYGQYKFYVFASDGVWALETTSDGYLERPQIVTPDIVLSDGDSITQIDGAVLFATDRGIMLISGSDSICISDMLNSSTPFRPIGDTPEEDLLPGLRNVAGELLEEIQMDVFRNFITDCRMTYDYPHQRIIIYSPSPKHDYAYVYSLKSKQWGMMPSKIESTPLNYPAALAMVSGEDGKNVLVDYSKDDIVDGVTRVENGLIITRPLKLDYPDVLKTVDTVIQRGKFQTGHVKSILYGSRDLLNWQLVWSSVDQYLRGFSGTPYKYFRLALLCDLQEGEDLMGCTVQFTPRLTDQLR